MNFAGQKDEASPNKDDSKHGRHDAHKHHDTMGEIVQAQGQGLPDNVKNKHVDVVDNHVKEVNPHSESLGTYQIDMYGNCVERDLKYHHSSTSYLNNLSIYFYSKKIMEKNLMHILRKMLFALFSFLGICLACELLNKN